MNEVNFPSLSLNGALDGIAADCSRPGLANSKTDKALGNVGEAL